MKIITTREIRNRTKDYFELAKKEKVMVKRGNKFVHLVVRDNPDICFLDEEWIEAFFAIPDEYRCNPFDISPTGDVFWADKRNVEQLNKSVQQAKDTNLIKLKKEDQKKLLGLE